MSYLGDLLNKGGRCMRPVEQNEGSLGEFQGIGRFAVKKKAGVETEG